MKTVKYLLQTSSILISILILLGSISFIKQDADILITIAFKVFNGISIFHINKILSYKNGYQRLYC